MKIKHGTALFATVAALTLSATSQAHAGYPTQQHDAQPTLFGVVEHTVLTPCATEDSINCWYNNPPGHPFYSMRVGSKQCFVYFNERYNRKHGHCDPLHR